MAQQTINLGATGNDGTGDTLRAGGAKINANFTELYQKTLTVMVQDPSLTTPLTTGTSVAMIPIDASLSGKNLIGCSARLIGQSSSGVVSMMLRRNRAGTDANMLSTALSIDASERSSSTAATPAVIDATHKDVVTDDFVYLDITAAGTGAYGLSITLTFF